MTSRQINQTKPSIRRITSLEEYFDIYNYDSSDNESKKDDSTPTKEQELNQLESTTLTTTEYIKQLILSFFGLELISQCISITSENVDDVINFVLLVCESLGLTVREEVAQETETTLCSSIFFRCCSSHGTPFCCLKVSRIFTKSTDLSVFEISLKLKGDHSVNFKDQYRKNHPAAYFNIKTKLNTILHENKLSLQNRVKKYKVQRSKRNATKRIRAQRKSDLELVRKLDDVVPRVVKYIEDGVAQSDEKAKEACDKYVKIANESKNGNQ